MLSVHVARIPWLKHQIMLYHVSCLRFVTKCQHGLAQLSRHCIFHLTILQMCSVDLPILSGCSIFVFHERLFTLENLWKILWLATVSEASLNSHLLREKLLSWIEGAANNQLRAFQLSYVIGSFFVYWNQLPSLSSFCFCLARFWPTTSFFLLRSNDLSMKLSRSFLIILPISCWQNGFGVVVLWRRQAPSRLVLSFLMCWKVRRECSFCVEMYPPVITGMKLLFIQYPISFFS